MFMTFNVTHKEISKKWPFCNDDNLDILKSMLMLFYKLSLLFWLISLVALIS